MSLKVTNLSKRYDDNWVLRNVSFEVEKCEVFGIFGATGAGKSTLIRLISGSEQPDGGGGTIHYNSSDVTTLSCPDRNFYFPRLTNDTFWENLFNTKNKSQLADGEGQVLALEEALQNAESVLLLDDSFCYMDRLLRLENYDKLHRTVDEKKLIVVIASNDFNEVMRLCERIAVLHEGEIKQIGTPREIYESPNSIAVARITGRNNLIEAERLSSSEAELPEFQTLTGNHKLFTRRVGKTCSENLNQNVTLAIRPEHISISFGASFPEDNLLKAEIIDIKFHGATTLIRLNSNGLILEALVLRLVGLNVGDECMVGLPPDRILVLQN
ncbi:MAG: transporter related protein [Acidobacteria bacterium]|jgi:ABC-type Fe3+/spermidine/putrescine transport system ATPase subunit|nr:transporter related protein [Acidobacteriota bacterium]